MPAARLPRLSLPRALLALLFGGLWLAAGAAAQPEPIRLKIVGGLAEVEQYTRFEAPFWTNRVPELTAGAVQAEIAPFDRSGIRAQDLPRLLRLGVVSFATVLLSVAAGNDPELDAIDLPLLSPDLPALRRQTELWRPRLATLLRERYGAELLAMYTYPAQVLHCRGAFTGLADLAGRRVRTSSVAQSELMAALGAVAVVTPFAELVQAMRSGVVDCAITGALSGNAIGLATVATHVAALPITWGATFFAANSTAWRALPASIRQRLAEGLMQLEEQIWQAAERANVEGLDCNLGRPGCPAARRGRMALVEAPLPEAERLRLITQVVLPGWARRCGPDCAIAWNQAMAPRLGLSMPVP